MPNKQKDDVEDKNYKYFIELTLKIGGGFILLLGSYILAILTKITENNHVLNLFWLSIIEAAIQFITNIIFIMMCTIFLISSKKLIKRKHTIPINLFILVILVSSVYMIYQYTLEMNRYPDNMLCEYKQSLHPDYNNGEPCNPDKIIKKGDGKALP